MPRIHFETPDGVSQTVEIENDNSLMEGAIANGIEGIDADCGGACACGTCRVIVGEAWREIIGSPGEDELVMLELAPEPTAGERLSCQIKVRDELDGLTVTVPDIQYR